MLGFGIEGIWGISIFGVGGVGLKAGVVDLLRLPLRSTRDTNAPTAARNTGFRV